ncbi:MAG: MBL fold metallo-hydrolase [Candidatus Parcubacteria bacterium]|nr:MBL fold metallo-hydrolase [Candidatus Parcubacteria bacterium]
MQRFIKNAKYYFLGLLLVAAIFVWYAVFREGRSGLEVDFLDVGQGDAIFIQAANGNQILLDSGPNKKVLSELGKVMPFYDRTIDLIIESHPDNDHIAGFVDVLKKYDVGAMMESGVVVDTPVYKELEKAIKENGIREILATRGMRINLGDEIYIDVLLPVVNNTNFSPHDGMVVLKLNYGKNSFLLAGDMEEKMEKYLISIDKNLTSNVLKIGHHGSKTSTSEALLGYINPDYAVISVGKDNKNFAHRRKRDDKNKIRRGKFAN